MMVAEYLVLAELIRKDVEAYSAISFRQPHYDITVVRPGRYKVRNGLLAYEGKWGKIIGEMPNTRSPRSDEIRCSCT